VLRISTFGGCFLERDGARLDGLSGQRKGLALFAVLAADAGGMTRESLSTLLWPESDDERARTSLRQLVHALRTQLAEPDLLLPSAELRLNPAVITSDVAEFREAIGQGDLDLAATLCRAPFLDGFYFKGADGIERWTAIERASLSQLAARNFEGLAERARTRDDVRDATVWWRRLATDDPLSARVAVGLMRALDAAGDRSAAVLHARVYETLVRGELESEPDRSVTELAAALRQAPASTAPVTPPATAPVTPPASVPVTPPASVPVTPPATAPAAAPGAALDALADASFVGSVVPPPHPPPPPPPIARPMDPPSPADRRRAWSVAALFGAALVLAVLVLAVRTVWTPREILVSRTPSSTRAEPLSATRQSVAVLPLPTPRGPVRTSISPTG